jgi:hypothetical protein
MIWEKNTTEFNKSLVQFLTDFGEHIELIKYIRTFYFLKDSFMRWGCCYQPAAYTILETDNYVESWHNQLKTTHLKRKPNRRVDRLTYILVKDVEEDYQKNVYRLMLNVGRMGPEERRRSYC